MCPELPHQREAVLGLQAEIEEEEGVAGPRHGGAHLGAVERSVDLEAGPVELGLQGRDDVGLVIDHQNARLLEPVGFQAYLLKAATSRTGEQHRFGYYHRWERGDPGGCRSGPSQGEPRPMRGSLSASKR